MAVLLGKPLLIHEQNRIAGLTNKILAKIADRILLAFPGALTSPENKTRVTGNPVRTEIARLPSPETRYAHRTGNLHILVVGGSLGAQVLNTVLPQALSMIPEDQRPYVTHQSGKAHLTLCSSLRRPWRHRKSGGIHREYGCTLSGLRSGDLPCRCPDHF